MMICKIKQSIYRNEKMEQTKSIQKIPKNQYFNFGNLSSQATFTDHNSFANDDQQYFNSFNEELHQIN